MRFWVVPRFRYDVIEKIREPSSHDSVLQSQEPKIEYFKVGLSVEIKKRTVVSSFDVDCILFRWDTETTKVISEECFMEKLLMSLKCCKICLVVRPCFTKPTEIRVGARRFQWNYWLKVVTSHWLKLEVSKFIARCDKWSLFCHREIYTSFFIKGRGRDNVLVRRIIFKIELITFCCREVEKVCYVINTVFLNMKKICLVTFY